MVVPGTLQVVVDSTQDSFLAHNLDTTPGQSGSPLWDSTNKVSCQQQLHSRRAKVDIDLSMLSMACQPGRHLAGALQRSCMHAIVTATLASYWFEAFLLEQC